MSGGTPEDGGNGEGRTRRGRSIDRREYLRSVGAAGAAGVVGTGAADAQSSGSGGPPAPQGLRVDDLGDTSIDLAWYHGSGTDGVTAAAYEVLVDDAVRQRVNPPESDGETEDDLPEVTATVGELEPGTTYEFAVRAVAADGQPSETRRVATSTLDPSTVDSIEFETGLPTGGAVRNWAATETLDAAHRRVRVRGKMGSGGTCSVGSLHEVTYDEGENALRVVVDAASDGSQICPAVVTPLGYEVTVTVARSPATVVVEHRTEEWSRSLPPRGAASGAGLALDRPDRPSLRPGRDVDVSVGLPDEPDGITGWSLEVGVVDPSVASLTALSFADEVVEDDRVSIAADGSNLRFDADYDPGRPPGESPFPLGTVTVAGSAAGTTRLTARVTVKLESGGERHRSGVTGTPLRVHGVGDGLPDSQVYPVERKADAVTVGVEARTDSGDAFRVTVDGDRVREVPAEETGTLVPPWAYGDFPTLTVDGLEPNTRYRIGVERLGADGEVTDLGEETVRTVGDEIVEQTFSPVDYGVNTDDEWGEVVVDDEGTAVRALGGFLFGSTPDVLWPQDVRLRDDGTLVLRVRESTGGDEAIQEFGFELDVELDEPVESVVLEYPHREWRRIWNGSLGGDYERFDQSVGETTVAPDERTEVALTVDGVPRAGAMYEYRVEVDDPSVARFVDASTPSWEEYGSDPSVSDDAVVIAEEVDPTQFETNDPVGFGTAVLEGEAPGSVTLQYVVQEREAVDGEYEERPNTVVGRVGPTVTVGDARTPPAVPGRENAPTDPDDDGLYEDVSGDGETDLADAVDLFQHRDSAAVTDHVSAYDFSGNDEIDLADVVHLFAEL